MVINNCYDFNDQRWRGVCCGAASWLKLQVQQDVSWCFVICDLQDVTDKFTEAQTVSANVPP